MRNKILLVDDEETIRSGVRSFLEAHGYRVEEASSCEQAVQVFREQRPDAAVLDYRLPDGNALDLLRRLRTIAADVPLLVLTGHGSIDLAVKAVKEGAENFVTKPVQLPTLLVMLERSIDVQRQRQKQAAGRTRLARDSINPFVGSSAAISELEAQCLRLVHTQSPILIEGETGVGKGVLASWFHRNGLRADEPFVDLNCAGLSKEFLETELFGHEQGAFTGAIARKQGLLEVAHRGTVFLDEIGDLDAEIQPKLLKVLEEQRFRRLGDHRDRTVDVQLIAATNQDLATAVDEGRFRSDLYYRVNTFPVRVPPLREREQDVLVLADMLLNRSPSRTAGKPRLSDDAKEALLAYSWPGNIRELRNVIERAVLLAPDDELSAQDLRFDASRNGTNGTPVKELTLSEMEQQHIRRILKEEKGHVARAATRLGVPRSTLYQKIKRYRIASR